MIDQGDEFLRIGAVAGTHSVKGWLKVYLITDNIERFSQGGYIFLKQKGSYNKYIISEFRPYKKMTGLLKLEGIDSMESAELLKKCEIFIPREIAEKDRKELGENTFYYFDIIGCDVFLNEIIFGIVTDILEAGAGEILIILDKSGKKHMVPFIESMVDTKKIGEKRIDIYPLEGLLDI